MTLFEGLVASRGRVLSTVNAARQEYNSRTAYVAADNITKLKVVYANFYWTQTNSVETGGGSTVTLYASVEYPAGTFTQIPWGGTDHLVSNSGDLSFSDYTPTLPVTIPSGATFWIRLFASSTVSFLYNAWRNSAMGELMELGIGVGSLTNKTLGGTITSGGNFSAPVLAIIAPTVAKSVTIIGDSIAAGKFDTAESTTAAGPGDVGSIAATINTTLPFLNLASGGMKASDWGGANWTKRQLLLAYSTHYVNTLSVNDLTGGANAATIKTNIQTMNAAVLAANPAAKITLTTMTPVSTGGSNWSTVPQTVGGTFGTQRGLWNTSVTTGAVTGNNNGYFDIALAVENSPGDGSWKVDGTAFKYTGDGTHPTPFGYDAIVSAGVVDMTKFT